MFPNVAAEDRLAFATGDGLAHERIVLVGGGNDFEFAAVHDEPGPAAAETADARRFKLFALKSSKLPNAALMSSASLPVGRAAGFRAP